MKNRVWVIEMYDENKKRYYPTVDAALSRDEARELIADWRLKCRHDKFLITKYVRAK